MVLRCHVEAPDSFVPKARYALETLLRPLGMSPAWTPDDPTLYYGVRATASSAPVALPLDEETLAYFAGRAPRDRARIVRRDDIPFVFGTPESPDPIASAFFFLSGWDEYVTTERDEHGRFCYRLSLQRDLDAATVPLVDRYRDRIAAALESAGMPVRRRTWGGKPWAFLPTFDIDYLREWRPGTIARDGLRRPWSVLRGLFTGADAYRDGFHLLLAALAEYETSGTFFFKAGDRSPYDPAYRRSRQELTRLLQMVREQGSEIGLHPGYYAATHPGYLHDEREHLEALAGERPTLIRQHYLRYELPTTSRLHVAEGFHVDSTLGYPDHEGFRRGTCLPFQVYDPVQDEALEVWEMPLCYMDAAMVVRRGLSAPEAILILEEMMRTCRNIGGACVALWHNTLWERGMEGWPEQLQTALAQAVEGEAWVGGLGAALDAWI